MMAAPLNDRMKLEITTQTVLEPPPAPAADPPQGGKLRVLLLMSDTGGGHRACSNAIAEALVRRFGPDGVEPHILDFFAVGRTTIHDRLTRLYGTAIRVAPWIYGFLWKLMNSKFAYGFLVRSAARKMVPRTVELLRELDPHVVVSVHPLVNALVVRAFEPLGARLPLAIMISDLVTIHVSWVDDQADAIFVATDAARRNVLEWGSRPDRVAVTGLPTSAAFGGGKRDAAEIRREMGLQPDRFTVLVMGGGEGVGALAEICAELNAAGFEGQIIVVCGRNEAVRRKLAARQWRFPAAILGFVDNMPDLMRAADIVAGKGGPQSIAETLASGRPMIVTGVLPGQERGNDTFVADAGAGFAEHRPREIARLLGRLQADPELVAQMRAKAAQALVSGAADRVAARIEELARTRSRAGTAP
ncbi:MAG: hypothetical protein K1X53_12830 [Candidatus Sumerlaeaceae bacterium]|nr:hypothetical protein [Candidatus Sumerlaeaceae bacterium]